MEKVKIIIPIYKADISTLERISLNRAVNILGSYPIVVIKPRSLNLDGLLADYPALHTVDFDDDFFRGIAGYNRLMLSRDFYRAFADTEYVLIYQLDAYVFEDRLAEWCDKGYDYVGGPWLKKPVYRLPVISTFRALQHRWMKLRHKPSKQDLYGKVGNGGLSLRKVSSFLRVLDNQGEQADYYASRERFHLFNEDVFWATVPLDFKYPDEREALKFSFDKYPAFCYRMNRRRLPFGCHAWYKRKMRSFWHRFIDF